MARARKAGAGGRASPDPARVRALLLRWYARNRRDLPWRRTSDPYAIWVAEIMLQQTRVATVLPYYRRFLRRFPDPASLAEATEEEVLGYWSGLGYYRRARALYEGARRVVAHHGGRVPRDTRSLRELPGIGPYTAGAIASIAFGKPEPVLDGNVRRVLSRVFGIGGRDARTSRTARRLWAVAAELARGRRPGDTNQALMELGALVCTPSMPSCGSCPLRATCRARLEGRPEAYPARRPRPRPSSVRVAVAWARRGGRVLLERPAENGPLRGRWDLPAIEVAPGADAAVALRSRMARRGLTVDVGPPVARLRHAVMNRRLEIEVLRCRVSRGRVAGRADLRWVEPEDLPTTAVSGATLKTARAAGAIPPDGRGPRIGALARRPGPP